MGIQQHCGTRGGVPVVVEHPMYRRAPVDLRAGVLGKFGRVGVQQIVQHEPARNGLGEQVGVDQLGEQRADPVDRDAGQAGRGRR
jgi:hypothetical protein